MDGQRGREAGWIKLHRSLLSHPIWVGERFTRGQAWVDLLMRASYEDHTVTRGTRVIRVKRGEVLTCQVTLAQRWRWHRSTVAKFLRFLADSDMISDIRTAKGSGIGTVRRTDIGYTLLKIRNFERYQVAFGAGSVIGNGHRSDTSSDMITDIRTSNIGEEGEEGEEHTPRESSVSVGRKLPPTTVAEGAFERFWALYPKKTGRMEAERAFRALEPTPELVDRIVTAVEEQRTWEEWTREGGRFIPSPAHWLRDGHWDDQPPDIEPPEPFGLKR